MMPQQLSVATILFTILLLIWVVRCASGCPVRLVDVPADDDPLNGGNAPTTGLSLSPEGLSYLSSLPSPIYIVPTLGVYRGGKSLLLNRIMNLTAPYAGGFGVGHAQSTHTRGIDICAEYIDGFVGGGQGGGTVVWMDTEGLWSSEYSRGRYGPKIFSLALLFASAVLLNSVKVLSDQFFEFFAEEQKVARMLKAGLREGCLPDDGGGAGGLLPDGLSLFWVLQQPITYGGADAASAMAEECKEDDECGADSGTVPSEAAALSAFLARPDDELRNRVRRDFVHRMHEVPLAAHDARRWEKLDTLPDDELLPEYVQSIGRLRTAVLRDLPRSRPLSNATIARQMQLYLNLVETEKFGAGLAREVFEEAEIEGMCNDFARSVRNLTGALPALSSKLGGAFIESRWEIEPRANASAELYHLDQGWKDRLQNCLSDREAEMRLQNAERILDKWREEAGKASEDGGRCYFLGGLLGGGSKGLFSRYVSTYKEDFDPARRKKAKEHARQLQRARLMECVRLRDILAPLAPLLGWLFCRAYLREGTPSSLGDMMFHGFIALGSYSFLQMTGQLPRYLDLDHAPLGDARYALELILQLPPSIPWPMLVRLIRWLCAAFAFFKITMYLYRIFRPAGAGYELNQMVNLELKVNRLMAFVEASAQTRIVDAALDASVRLKEGDGRAAFRTLLSGIMYAISVGDRDLERLGVSAGFTKKAIGLTKRLKVPLRECKDLTDARRLDQVVLSRDIQKILDEMVYVLYKTNRGQK